MSSPSHLGVRSAEPDRADHQGRLGFDRHSSEIKVPHIAGVRGDEVATAFDVVAHQHAHDHVGLGGLFDGDLQQRAGLRVNGCLSEFLPVHFTETFQALELFSVIWFLCEEPIFRRSSLR